jgi:hypothetical protein
VGEEKGGRKDPKKDGGTREARESDRSVCRRWGSVDSFVKW